MVTVKDAKNNVITYGYDVLGRRTSITDARNNTFTTTYDANGNVLKTVDAKGNTISETTYNNLNLPLTVTDATGKTTTYTYNALGKVATATDSMNNRQEFTYNSRGLNTSVKDALNNNSTAVYDVLGNITRLAGPLNGGTDYTYDDMGRLTSESTASGGTVTYGYNALNIKNQVKNARNQTRTYNYDALGRVTGYTSPEGPVSYTYDANGNVLTITDSNGTITREYDALNRVTSYTDTYGKTIGYEYDSVGNLTKITYPDNTTVTYAYDANKNLTRVTDWANRVTTYTYDVNNRVIGVTKPDGSTTTTAYDNKQRVVSSVERKADNTVISGFSYIYDTLGRISEETHLDKNEKLCYTYDVLNRVTARTVKNATTDEVISTESFTYDAAGNITGGSANTTFVYDTNNRLVTYNGSAVSYDLDGNMLSNGSLSCTYDSANRLISAGGNTYTYNAEDVRIKNVHYGVEEQYTYHTNCKLSKMLMRTVGTTVTKYVYGLGLISEETNNTVKVYHFDYRGSTVAVTDSTGTIMDTFEYDTYGKIIGRTGTSDIIFCYNGRLGVVTDNNNLIYMRARYYSSEMRRFVNADILHGKISDSTSLNRYAYVNGNPVSNVDPFGLSAERGTGSYSDFGSCSLDVYDRFNDLMEIFGWGVDIYDFFKYGFRLVRKGNNIIVKGARTAAAVRRGIAGTKYSLSNAGKYWDILGGVNVSASLKNEFLLLKPSGKGFGKLNGNAVLNYAGILLIACVGVVENIEAGTRTQKIVSDAIVDIAVETGISAASTAAGAFVFSFIPVPILGTVFGAGVGYCVGEVADWLINKDFEILGDKSIVDWAKDGAAAAADWIVEDLPDIAADAWEATTDFVEDAWDATIDFIEDTGEAVEGFFEYAGNAIGGFFSELFA